jgi:hypothetical protein
LADERQKRKSFLSVNRTFLTVDRLNLSFRIERFQRVEVFPFLTTKNPKPIRRRSAFQQRRRRRRMLDPFSRTPHAALSNANRSYFAEQIPQLTN